MNIRTLVPALAAAASLLPSISTASPVQASLNSCARAFAASIAAPGAAPPAYKLDYRDGRFASSFPQFYTRVYIFDLQAHDPKTGVIVARATCFTNVHGAVTGLSSVPLDAGTATLAAQL